MTAHPSSSQLHANFSFGGARTFLFLGVFGLLTMPVGCTGGSSENPESTPPNAAAQPAQPAPAPPVQPAPAKPAQAAPAAPGNLAMGKGDDKPSKPVKRGGRDKDEVAPSATPNQPTKPIMKPVAEWTIDDMKTALVNKDLRYVAAVMGQAAKAPGDAQKGTEMGSLLEAVANMPADAIVPGAAAIGGRGRRDKDDETSQPSAISPAPGTPGATAGNGPPPAVGGLGFGKGND